MADADYLVGLWPFEAKAEQRLVGALKSGQLSAREADEIRRFAKNGYVIFPQAIPSELVDELVRDVARIADQPGHFVTTDHRNGRTFRLSGSDFDAFESVFDVYVNCASARKIAFHPTITRFLGLIFDTPVIALQQLLFQRSNQHPLHQDTSVVCTEHPLLIAATWIALEDVVPGRGELTYYEGSQRISHYFYSDGSKRFDPRVDDAEEARRHLLRECERLGCIQRDFIAKKGDVFVWSADLVHGSKQRTRPEHETRRSLVTHYYSRKTRPFWFRFHPKHQRAESFEGRASYVSRYYELPTAGRLVRPSFSIPD